MTLDCACLYFEEAYKRSHISSIFKIVVYIRAFSTFFLFFILWGILEYLFGPFRRSFVSLHILSRAD